MDGGVRSMIVFPMRDLCLCLVKPIEVSSEAAEINLIIFREFCS